MSDDDEVGYRRPPKHGRFKKGRSGNPKGRPKGTKNFRTILQEQLAEPVSVRENGKVTRVSTQHAALMKLRAKALNGDQRALDHLLALAERYALEDAADERELSQSDQTIIEHFKERVIQEHETEKNINQDGDHQEESP